MKIILIIICFFLFPIPAIADDLLPWSSTDQFTRKKKQSVYSFEIKSSGAEEKKYTVKVGKDFYFSQDNDDNYLHDFGGNFITNYKTTDKRIGIMNSYAFAEFIIYELRNRVQLGALLKKSGSVLPPNLILKNVETELNFHFGRDNHELTINEDENKVQTISIGKEELGNIRFSKKKFPKIYAEIFWKGFSQKATINPHFVDYLIEQRKIPIRLTSIGLSYVDGYNVKKITYTFEPPKKQKIKYPLPKGKTLDLGEELIFNLSPSATKLKKKAIEQYTAAIKKGLSLKDKFEVIEKTWIDGNHDEAFIDSLGTYAHFCSSNKLSSKKQEMCNTFLAIVQEMQKRNYIINFFQALSPKPETSEKAVRTLLSFKERLGSKKYFIDDYIANTLVTHKTQMNKWNMDGLDEVANGPDALFINILQTAPWNFNFYKDVGDRFINSGNWNTGWLMYNFALELNNTSKGNSGVIPTINSKMDYFDKVTPLLFSKAK